MKQMLTTNIALDIFSIVLSLIPIVYLLSNQRYRQRLNRYFLYICLSNVVMIIGDLADWIMQDTSEPHQKIILTVLTVVYYVASAFVLYYFARYMDEYLKLSGRVRKGYLAAVTAVCGIQTFFSVISPLTGSFFYVADDGYHRGALFLLSQMVPLFCYLLFTVVVISYRKRLAWREVIFFLLYIVFPLVGLASQMLLRGIGVLNVSVSLSLLLIFVNIQFEREMLLQQKDKELDELHVDIMLSQIQPHFLYNALTTIRQLCDIDPKLAKESIRDFSYFLRGNMGSLKSKAPIPFEQELSHARYYLKLEQQRFVDRLCVETDAAVTDFFIPPLTLQPLVENAVRHGIMMRDEGGTLTIRTEETADAYIVTVSDDGVGFLPESPPQDGGTHIGIQNVRKRLQTMCRGSLNITSVLGEGTVAAVVLPKEGAV